MATLCKRHAARHAPTTDARPQPCAAPRTRRAALRTTAELRTLPSKSPSTSTTSTPTTSLQTASPSALPSTALASSSIEPSIPPVDPLVAITSALAFAAVASDVFDPHSVHFLASPDAQVHAYVTQNLPLDFRVNVANPIISNIAIYLGILGLGAGSVLAALKDPRRGVPLVGLTWASYFLGCGYIRKGEPLVLGAIKEYFGRARPSDWHANYSFPSGHSTAATFIIGTLAFVICPFLLSGGPAQQAQLGEVAELADKELGQSEAIAQLPVPALTALTALAEFCQGNWVLVMACWALTASGRLMADVHWVSDTVGGLFFGAFSVSVLVGAVRLVHSVQGGDGGSGKPEEQQQSS